MKKLFGVIATAVALSGAAHAQNKQESTAPIDEATQKVQTAFDNALRETPKRLERNASLGLTNNGQENGLRASYFKTKNDYGYGLVINKSRSRYNATGAWTQDVGSDGNLLFTGSYASEDVAGFSEPLKAGKGTVTYEHGNHFVRTTVDTTNDIDGPITTNIYNVTNPDSSVTEVTETSQRVLKGNTGYGTEYGYNYDYTNGRFTVSGGPSHIDGGKTHFNGGVSVRHDFSDTTLRAFARKEYGNTIAGGSVETPISSSGAAIVLGVKHIHRPNVPPGEKKNLTEGSIAVNFPLGAKSSSGENEIRKLVILQDSVGTYNSAHTAEASYYSTVRQTMSYSSAILAQSARLFAAPPPPVEAPVQTITLPTSNFDAASIAQFNSDGSRTYGTINLPNGFIAQNTPVPFEIQNQYGEKTTVYTQLSSDGKTLQLYANNLIFGDNENILRNVELQGSQNGNNSILNIPINFLLTY